MLDFDTNGQTLNAGLALQPNQGSAAQRVMPRRPKSMTMREAVAVAHGRLQPIGEDMKNIFADIFDTPRQGERTYSASDLRAMMARKRLIKRPALAAPPTSKEPPAHKPEAIAEPAPVTLATDQLGDLRQVMDTSAAEAAASDQRPSLPMFLAIHAMNLVLLVVFAPIGLALTLFSLIKGPDLRLTANSLVMTGLLLGFGEVTWMAIA